MYYHELSLSTGESALTLENVANLKVGALTLHVAQALNCHVYSVNDVMRISNDFNLNSSAET